MPKFPELIHVVREDDSDSSYLVAYENGIADIDEPDTTVAIYRLVKVGRVRIEKSFDEKKGRA